MANSEHLWRDLCHARFPRSKGEEVDEGVTWKARYFILLQGILVCEHAIESKGGPEDVARYLRHLGHRGTIHPPSLPPHSHSTAITAEPLSVNYEILSKETPEGWLKFFKKELKAFVITIFFTNGRMKDPVRDRVGDILADYVDAGNAVIIGVFANARGGSPIFYYHFLLKNSTPRPPPHISAPISPPPQPMEENPGGRWEKEVYGPILRADYTTGNLTIGKKLIPDHPILRNVHSICCWYHTTGDAHPKATRIANLSNGTPLVAEREFPGGGVVVSVNIFLPSEKSGDGGWRRGSSNHVDILLSNICNYLISSIPRRSIQRRRRGEQMVPFESHSTTLEAGGQKK